MKTIERPYHIPVLIDEVLKYLNPQPGKIYVDATFGGGGHTAAILRAQPHCQVIAIDWDTVALETNGAALQEEFGERLTLIWGNFAQIDRLLAKEKINRVDGILSDFGTSQYQIFQRPGFSFAVDTPLDMRMSPAHQKMTAAEVLNKASLDTLIEIFKYLGEEPRAVSIAKAIVQQRKTEKFYSTKQLASLVQKVVGSHKGKIHPATKIFQALRIYVNKELENIHSFLRNGIKVLNDGGRLVCISFHSLEDRMVKEFFKNQELEYQATLLTKRPVTATLKEVKENPASRSAKLRAIEVFQK
jgi:16S rRNA (cytosine1402-N4)-methyltransferase